MADEQNREALVREMVREGEVQLQAQLLLATSADQRASNLAGIYTAAGTAIIGAILAIQDLDITVVIGGAVTGLLFLGSAAICISTLLPVAFFLPGNEPKNWLRDLEQDTKIEIALEEEGINFQDKIDTNRSTMGGNAKRFQFGAVLGIAAPAVGLVSWSIFSCFVAQS